MNKIICGFAGIGKSQCAKQIAGVVDLESTPFNKEWSTYVRVAQHMQKNGYTVLMSCHKELRDYMLRNEVKFLTIIPEPVIKGTAVDSKAVYLKRYEERGNTPEFVKLMSNNWGEFNTALVGEKIYELPLDKYLSDVIETFKERP